MKQTAERVARPALSWAFFSRLAGRAVREFSDDLCPHLAASIAYRVLFSIFPLAVVLAAILGIVADPDTVVDAIVDNVPLTASGKADLRELLDGVVGHLDAVGLVGLAGLVWAASGLMTAIRTALNAAWDTADEARPWLRGKALDLLLLGAVALLVLLSFGLTIGTRFVRRFASSALDTLGLGASADVVFGLVIPFTLALIATVFLYRVVPAGHQVWSGILPAALVVAAAFAGLQSLFGFYLAHFGNYNAIYGSLGAVIAFLLFIYISASVFLLGAELAAEWPRVRDEIERGEDEGEPGPPFVEQLEGFLKGLVVRRRP